MASEPLTVRDDFGDAIEIEADRFMATTPDGSISPAGAVLIASRAGKQLVRMRLSGERLAAFREAVDRTAMPGQPVRGAGEAADEDATAVLAASIEAGTTVVVEDDSPFADRRHDPAAAWTAGDDEAYGLGGPR